MLQHVTNSIWATGNCCRHLGEGDRIPRQFCLLLSLHSPCPFFPHLWLQQLLSWHLSNLCLNPEVHPSPEYLAHILSKFQTEQVQTCIHYLLPKHLPLVLCSLYYVATPLPGFVQVRSLGMVYHCLSISPQHLGSFRPLLFLLASWSWLSNLPPQSLFYTAARESFWRVNHPEIQQPFIISLHSESKIQARQLATQSPLCFATFVPVQSSTPHILAM